MLDASRLKAQMEHAGVSQSELARRVGVTQPTIFRLVHGQVLGSSHLHRVARALGTTPAYLSGEVDDPEIDAPTAPLSSEQREWLDLFDELSKVQRSLLRQMARELVNRPPSGTVHAPGEE